MTLEGNDVHQGMREQYRSLGREVFKKNPLGSMALGMMGSLLFSEQPWTYLGILASSGIYFGLSTQEEKEKQHSIVDHPRRNALVAAALVGAYQLTPIFDEQYRWNPKWENIILLGAMMGLAGFVADIGTRLGRSITKITYDHTEEKKGIVRIIDQALEHPFAVGVAAGLARLPFMSAQMNIPVITGATMGVTATGVAAASALMHSTNREYYRQKRILRPYFHLRKRYAKTKEAGGLFFKKEVECQEKIIKKEIRLEDRIQQTIHLGDLFQQEGNEDQALVYYRKAARLFGKKGNAITSRDILAEFLDIGSFYRVLLQEPLREPDTENELIGAGFQGLVHRNPNALRYWDTLRKKYPEKREYVLLYAKGLEIAVGKKESRAFVLRLVRDALENEGLLPFDRASRNVVGVLKNKILQTEVIVKGTEEKGMLEGEYAWTSYAEELFSGVADVTVPRPIGVIYEGEKIYYVAELEEGIDLYQLMREGKATRADLENALAALAVLHTKLPLKKVQEPERDEIDYLGKRLQKYADIIPVSIIVEKLRLLQKYIPRLSSVPLKDAHPENFRKNEGLCVLDWERLRPGSVALEYANLLGYTAAVKEEKRFTEEEKEQVIGSYIEKMRHLGKKDIGTKDEHIRAYLSTVPLRVLQWLPSLEQRGRKETIETSIANARGAVNRVERRFPEYYRQGRETYHLVDATLRRLEQALI